jgi:hypothetical protein
MDAKKFYNNIVMDLGLLASHHDGQGGKWLVALSYEELNEMFSKVFVPAIMDVGSMFSLLKFHPACQFLLSPNLPLLSPSRIFT